MSKSSSVMKIPNIDSYEANTINSANNTSYLENRIIMFSGLNPTQIADIMRRGKHQLAFIPI